MVVTMAMTSEDAVCGAGAGSSAGSEQRHTINDLQPCANSNPRQPAKQPPEWRISDQVTGFSEGPELNSTYRLRPQLRRLMRLQP